MSNLKDILEELAARFIINQPYFDGGPVEVFDILISMEAAYWHYVDFYFKKFKSPIHDQKQFINAMCKIVPPLEKYKDLIKSEIPEFSSIKSKIPVAGVICFNKDKSKVICVRDASANHVLGFPKGKLGEGETPAQAAIREAIEEIGIDVSPYFVESQYKTFSHRKQYHFYYVIGVPEDIPMVTVHRNEVIDRKWYRVKDLRMEQNLGKLLSKMIDWVEQLSNS